MSCNISERIEKNQDRLLERKSQWLPVERDSSDSFRKTLHENRNQKATAKSQKSYNNGDDRISRKSEKKQTAPEAGEITLPFFLPGFPIELPSPATDSCQALSVPTPASHEEPATSSLMPTPHEGENYLAYDSQGVPNITHWELPSPISLDKISHPSFKGNSGGEIMQEAPTTISSLQKGKTLENIREELLKLKNSDPAVPEMGEKGVFPVKAYKKIQDSMKETGKDDAKTPPTVINTANSHKPETKNNGNPQKTVNSTDSQQGLKVEDLINNITNLSAKNRTSMMEGDAKETKSGKWMGVKSEYEKNSVSAIKNQAQFSTPVSPDTVPGQEIKTVVVHDQVSLQPSRLVETLQKITQEFALGPKGDEKTITLTMDPPHLGKVQVTLSMQESTLNARFQCEGETARLIREGIPQLKETLSQSGISLGESWVGSQQGGQAGNNRQGESYNSPYRKDEEIEAVSSLFHTDTSKKKGTPGNLDRFV